jgi:hypothetical protein
MQRGQLRVTLVWPSARCTLGMMFDLDLMVCLRATRCAGYQPREDAVLQLPVAGGCSLHLFSNRENMTKSTRVLLATERHLQNTPDLMVCLGPNPCI